MKIKIMGSRFSKLMNGYSAITLYPFGIYVQKNPSVDTINHESIHWQQQKEMLCIFFYIWYLLEWIIKLFIYGKNAYYNISFEREAYKNSSNNKYLISRKKYLWVKYIFKQ